MYTRAIGMSSRAGKRPERRASDRDDGNFAASSPGEPFHVIRVAGQNHGFLSKGYRYHDSVNDIGGSGNPE